MERYELAVFILFMAILFGGLFGAIAYKDHMKHVTAMAMANKGYCQTSVVGSSELAWVKCSNEGAK